MRINFFYLLNELFIQSCLECYLKIETTLTLQIKVCSQVLGYAVAREIAVQHLKNCLI